MSIGRLVEVFPSTLLYFIVFCISLLFYFFAEIEIRRNKNDSLKFRQVILLFIAILPPCILAGLRADGVGVDTAAMVRQMNSCSSLNTFREIVEKIDSTEYAYAVLVYIVTRITSNPWMFLFMLQFCTIVPITLATVIMRKEISISVAMAVYLFCFYNNSLNAMRQSISCAFIILAVSFILLNGIKLNKQAIISYALAFFNHKYAFIGIVATYGIIKISKSKVRKIAKLLIYILIIILPISFLTIYELMLSRNMVNESTYYYAQIFLYRSIYRNWFSNPFSIYNVTDVIFRVSWIIVPFICAYRSKADFILKNLRTICTCGLFIFIIILYSFNTNYGCRISWFFDMFIILLFPCSVRGPQKKIKKVLIIVTVISYWFIFVMLGGWSGSSVYVMRN